MKPHKTRTLLEAARRDHYRAQKKHDCYDWGKARAHVWSTFSALGKPTWHYAVYFGGKVILYDNTGDREQMLNAAMIRVEALNHLITAGHPLFEYVSSGDAWSDPFGDGRRRPWPRDPAKSVRRTLGKLQRLYSLPLAG